MRPPEVPWCQASLTGSEARYLAQAAAAGQVGPAGEFLDRFEKIIARLAGARHAVATSSGTAALHIALILAGVRPGDEVLTSAWTFVATANAIHHAGAHPVALDIDPGNWQLDPAQVEWFLDRHCDSAGGQLTNNATGRPITAIVPVHLLGHPADLDRLRGLAARYGLAMVEDAAQALGARYKGRPVGSGGIAALSFNLNKIITTGGGGAVLTDNPGLAARARYLISQARDDAAEYRHAEVGWNYRMSNLHAAVGVAQAERLDDIIRAKHRIRGRYADALAGLPGVTFQAPSAWAEPTWWFTTISIGPQASASGSPARAHLARLGIQAGPPWTPLHLTGAHRGCAPGPCPAAEHLGRTAIHLPCSATLSTVGQDRVITAIRDTVAALLRPVPRLSLNTVGHRHLTGMLGYLWQEPGTQGAQWRLAKRGRWCEG
jgi:perosamine synthetase